MSLSIRDELSQMRGYNAHEAGRQASDQQFLDSMTLSDQSKANSMQGVRTSSGRLEMSGTYRADTMIDVGGGVMSRVDAAIAAGLINPDTMGKPLTEDKGGSDAGEGEQIEPEAEESSADLDISNVYQSVPQEDRVQITYVETVLGEADVESVMGRAFVDGLAEDDPAVERLVQASGLSPEEAWQSTVDALEAKAAPVVAGVAQMIGHAVDPNHLMAYVMSSAVSPKQRGAVQIAMRTGNVAGLGGLVEQYKRYNANA